MKNFVAGLFVFALLFSSSAARAEYRTPLLDGTSDEWVSSLKVTSAWEQCGRYVAVADTVDGRYVLFSFSFLQKEDVIERYVFLFAATLTLTTDIDLFYPMAVVNDDNKPSGLVMNSADRAIAEDCFGKRMESKTAKR